MKSGGMSSLFCSSLEPIALFFSSSVSMVTTLQHLIQNVLSFTGSTRKRLSIMKNRIGLKIFIIGFHTRCDRDQSYVQLCVGEMDRNSSVSNFSLVLLFINVSCVPPSLLSIWFLSTLIPSPMNSSHSQESVTDIIDFQCLRTEFNPHI